MEYTNEEYCDMLLIYGACDGNSYEARRMYIERFPHRRIPNPNVFHRLINRVRTTGSVIPVRKNVGAGRDFTARTYENEEEVLRIAEENPSISIRAMSREIGISKSTVHTILKENEMHAFHYSKVQQLLPQDYAQRINFCTWLLNQEE